MWQASRGEKKLPSPAEVALGKISLFFERSTVTLSNLLGQNEWSMFGGRKQQTSKITWIDTRGRPQLEGADTWGLSS